MMKNDEITSCKVRIKFLNQTPLLLLAKFPFNVLMGLKFER